MQTFHLRDAACWLLYSNQGVHVGVNLAKKQPMLTAINILVEIGQSIKKEDV
jgi:hypothetical protein